jgi:hypothetical protein
MKFNFKVNENFAAGIKRLSDVLGYEISDSGITVINAEGDKIGVTYKDKIATVYHKNKVQFFRGIGVLLENLKKSEEFEVFFDTHFDTLSGMIDSSRCGVPRISSIKKSVPSASGRQLPLQQTNEASL